MKMKLTYRIEGGNLSTVGSYILCEVVEYLREDVIG
jgi:hypothetical protein